MKELKMLSRLFFIILLSVMFVFAAEPTVASLDEGL